MPKKPAVLKSITTVLNDVMAISLDDLEKIMQQAHECDAKRISDPPQRFAISRQALRMLWHFRCNLDAVEIYPNGEKGV